MKKYPIILQDGLKDCGVSCLLMIMKSYGGEASIEYLRNLTKTTKEGVNAKAIIDAASKLNFSATGVNGNVEDLTDNMLPCIAHVIIDNKFKHFVVIYKKDKKKILIGDPRVGLKRLSLEQFKEISTGNYILLKPNKQIPILKRSNKFQTVVLKNIIESKKLFIHIILLSLLYTLLNILLSFNFKFIIDYAINYSSKINVYAISCAIILVIIFKEISNYLRNIILNSINHKLDLTLIKDIYNHILSLPYLYYKNRTTGEIISRMQDMNSIRDVISKLFMTIFVDFILVLSVLFVLFKLNITLTFISILIMLSYVVIILLFRKILNSYITESKEQSALVNSYLVETISGLETIKGLNQKDKFYDEFSKKYYQFIKISNQYGKIFLTETFVKELIQLIGISILIMVGSVFVINNEMTISELITYHSLIFYFLEPIRNIIDSDVIYREAIISIKRIMELYEVHSETLTKDDLYTGQIIEGNIKINNLSYSYNGKDNILNHINLNINPGDKILLYGESGNGKSTIAKILMKYLDVAKEHVLIDGKDLSKYNVLDIRNNICHISQNEFLFTDTIYNNINLNNKKYSYFDEISSICMIKDIYKNNILAYDMLLEENGFNLSGGERQRIILARALMEDKKIYILDESLSEIDIEKERYILKNIFEKYKDKTIIVISHRFNNNDLFNRKVEIKGGFCYER